ncbi:tyrosine-type recombinase/integrase [Microbacterium sp. HA-8]|uniref:tyrosine-type recombinase/integrase n=1 Tax=Microbacterium sp. HA-8 TaxID=3234200 RepID=UPI0038F64D4F
MTRAGLGPGDIGNVAFIEKPDGFLARVRYRRQDGTEGRIARKGSNKQAARRAVMEAARERIADFELDAGLALTRDSTVAELAEAYLAIQDERNGGNTPQYLNDEASVVRKYIIEKPFGKTTLRGLRPSVITAEHRAILVTHKKPGRARQWATVIQKLTAYAYELDLMNSNPCVGLKFKRPKVVKQHAATDVEVEVLQQVAHAYATRPNRRGPKPTPLLLDVADIIAGTGMRIGEALALRWAEDVDLDGEVPVVYVRGTVVEGHRVKKHRQPYPKTEDSERGIPIPDYAVDMLRRRKVESLGQHAHVFETATGLPVGQHQVRLQMWKARDWALTQDDQPNIDVNLTMHALRRGVATEVSASHDIVVAAKVLGNKQSAITEKHYAKAQMMVPDVRATLQKYGRRSVVRKSE